MPLHLHDFVERVALIIVIFANDQLVIAFEAIGRNREIVGGRYTLIDTTCKIIGRAMTRTKITLIPIDDGFGLVVGNAAKVSADADKNCVFRLDGARPIFCVFRLLMFPKLML